MLVRFIALSLICVSAVEFALYWIFESQHNHTPVEIFPCIIKSIPALLGVVVSSNPKPSRNGFRTNWTNNFKGTMQGYLSIVLHAHLPFVRHPEHEKFLEESWLLRRSRKRICRSSRFWKAGRATGLTPADAFAFADAVRDAARSAAARALRTASERPDRTGRKGNPSHALGPRVPRTRVDVSP